MILVYAITLGTSAGVTGLFVRQALAEQGYVPGLMPGVMAACAAAAVYAGLQLVYVGLVRLAWPTKSNTPLLGESLSHAAVAAFFPYLAHVKVPWPHPALQSFESFIYLAAFASLHVGLKLVAFYGILRSPPGPRVWNAAWVALAVPLLFAGSIMFKVWADGVEKARPRAPETVETVRVGTAYAQARALPEGSVLSVDATASLGDCLMFACAAPQVASTDDEIETAYLTVEMRGETTTRFAGPVDLKDDAWSYLQVPADQLPRKMTSCVVRWSTEKESKWRAVVGVLPVLTSERKLLVAGPDLRAMPRDGSPPSVAMIVIDGLGSDRVSSMGSARGTTPNLDRLAQSAVTYPFVFTPAPEAPAACMTLLTGVSPLRHGYLGAQAGPLPEDSKTITEALRAGRYATAAFTEGELPGDLVHGRGFERGFDCFDDGYSVDAAPGSANTTPGRARTTLQRAQDWIDACGGSNFFVFVRLASLRDASLHGRTNAIAELSATGQAPSAEYNGAIAGVDRELGDFLAHIKASPFAKTTCIVVTSTRGSYLPDTALLPDWSLRVPLIIAAPGTAPSKRNELAALEDVPSTLAKLLRVDLSPYASTADLINAPVSREPISMTGSPLVLTTRDAKLRLVWSTQREPFTMRSAGLPAAASLYDLTRERAGTPPLDISARNPQKTKDWTDKLERYLMMQSEGWQAK